MLKGRVNELIIPSHVAESREPPRRTYVDMDEPDAEEEEKNAVVAVAAVAAATGDVAAAAAVAAAVVLRAYVTPSRG